MGGKTPLLITDSASETLPGPWLPTAFPGGDRLAVLLAECVRAKWPLQGYLSPEDAAGEGGSPYPSRHERVITPGQGSCLGLRGPWGGSWCVSAASPARWPRKQVCDSSSLG